MRTSFTANKVSYNADKSVCVYCLVCCRALCVCLMTVRKLSRTYTRVSQTKPSVTLKSISCQWFPWHDYNDKLTTPYEVHWLPYAAYTILPHCHLQLMTWLIIFVFCPVRATVFRKILSLTTNWLVRAIFVPAILTLVRTSHSANVRIRRFDLLTV